MGTWGYGSADSDSALDGYPSELFEDGSREICFPPHVKKLEYFLDQIVGTKDVKRPSVQAQYIGVVLLGIKDKVVPAKKYLVKAKKFVQALVNNQDYLSEFDSPKGRQNALFKELVAIERLLTGKDVSKMKLQTGLLETVTQSSNPKSAKKAAEMAMKGRKKVSSKKGQAKKKISARKSTSRPSPAESATKFEPGTKKKGGDGGFWVVRENKNGVHRWVKVR